MTPRYARPGRRGFTLIELVVAMAMVAILSMSLYASMRAAFRAKASAEAAVEPSRTAEVAMGFVRDDLQNALPPKGLLAGTFEGTDQTDDRGLPGDDLIFCSTSDMREHASGNGEIKKIELTVEVPDGETRHCLIRRCARNLLSELDVTPDEEVLVRGVDGFNLRYFDGSVWNDTWDSTQEDNQLPAAVEVTLTLDRSTPQEPRVYHFTRVFQLSCSNATYDTNVNSGAGQ